jgi:hypothetical protein
MAHCTMYPLRTYKTTALCSLLHHALLQNQAFLCITQQLLELGQRSGGGAEYYNGKRPVEIVKLSRPLYWSNIYPF